MITAPQVDRGYRLLHEGVEELSRIEANGIRIDRKYLDETMAELKARMSSLRERLRDHKVWKAWRRRFAQDSNMDSREQLGKILFEDLGYQSKGMTAGGDRYDTDEAVLESLNIGWVKGYLKLQKLIKAHNTYLMGIKRELDVFGFLHPVFNLHTVLTYRSSSDSPNFQNMPIRNPEIGKLIRRAFIARDGHVLVENDFKGVEVSVAACYHKDPTMLAYIKDETKDMHRDMAMQLFIFTAKEWKRIEKKMAKRIRHVAKNCFVFPEFYGDWWKSCAESIWKDISQLQGPNGEPLIDWLKSKGISGLGESHKDADGKWTLPEEGTFMAHVREVENDFWNNRFGVYGKWKKKWYDAYLESGQFESYTGFVYRGVMLRNEVINYAVQGSAFHCLLWSLVRIQRELRRRKMKTKIVGQIHDSIIADVKIEELDEYLALVRQVTEVDILAEYKWLITPLSIECEISPIGTTWHDKREVKINRSNNTYSVEGFNGSACDLLKFWAGEGKI